VQTQQSNPRYQQTGQPGRNTKYQKTNQVSQQTQTTGQNSNKKDRKKYPANQVQ
jgi:hypothetical protein